MTLICIGDYCFLRNNGRCFACCMFLLCNGNGRTNIFYMFKHEDRIFFCVLEFLEEEKRFFVIT